MKQFFSLIKKEFFHISRDKYSLFVLLGMPIAQILIFGFALTNEVKDTRIAILDQSKDVHTEGLIQQIQSSNYFDIEIKNMPRPGRIRAIAAARNLDLLPQR